MPSACLGLTRRTLPRLAAGTTAAGIAGLAAGDSSDRVRIDVGHARQSGERAASRQSAAFCAVRATLRP